MKWKRRSRRPSSIPAANSSPRRPSTAPIAFKDIENGASTKPTLAPLTGRLGTTPVPAHIPDDEDSAAMQPTRYPTQATLHPYKKPTTIFWPIYITPSGIKDLRPTRTPTATVTPTTVNILDGLQQPTSYPTYPKGIIIPPYLEMKPSGYIGPKPTISPKPAGVVPTLATAAPTGVKNMLVEMTTPPTNGPTYVSGIIFPPHIVLTPSGYRDISPTAAPQPTETVDVGSPPTNGPTYVSGIIIPPYVVLTPSGYRDIRPTTVPQSIDVARKTSQPTSNPTLLELTPAGYTDLSPTAAPQPTNVIAVTSQPSRYPTRASRAPNDRRWVPIYIPPWVPYTDRPTRAPTLKKDLVVIPTMQPTRFPTKAPWERQRTWPIYFRPSTDRPTMAPTALKKSQSPTMAYPYPTDDDDYYSRKTPKNSKPPVVVEGFPSPPTSGDNRPSNPKSSKASASPNYATAPVKHGGVTYLMPIPSKEE